MTNAYHHSVTSQELGLLLVSVNPLAILDQLQAMQMDATVMLLHHKIVTQVCALIVNATQAVLIQQY